MKNKFYFKYFLLWLIIILVFNYKLFFWTKKSEEDKQVKTALALEVWNIKESIEVVGNVELVDEQQLGFNIAWTVTRVNFKAWDTVKKGEIIAEIDNTDALNTIKDAQISLDNAKISLSQLYDTPDESKIMSSKNSITNAENSLNSVTKELENLKISQENAIKKQSEDIENSKKELQSSKNSLSLAKTELENLIKEKQESLDNTISNKSTTIKNIEDSFKTYLIEIEKMILEADYILWVTDKNASLNDYYEIYLWANNSSYKLKASNLLLNNFSSFYDIQKQLNSYDYSWEKEKIIELSNSFKNIYNEIYDMEESLFKTAENSVVSDWIFSQSQIESIKTNATTARNTSLSRINTINTNINTLNTLSDTDLISDSNQTTIKAKEESIKNQEINISKQEVALNNSLKLYEESIENNRLALKNKEDDLWAKKDSLEVAKRSYDELIEWPTAENVKKQQNAITQAELRIENARKNLDDYRLEAPFDGIVRKIDHMVWDNLKNDTDKYVYLENPDLVEIIVKLDQIDIVTVDVWDRAIVTFDAYSNEDFDARVSLIDTTPILSSGVVSYEVKIILDDWTFDKTLLSGMTANVEIVTNEKENVFLINSQAIISKWNQKFVNVLKDREREEIEEVEIQAGISSWWQTEIISGLEEGDIIIYEKIIFTSTWNWGIKMWWPMMMR